MENDAANIDNSKFRKRQNRIFYWSIAGFFMFILSWTASSFRSIFGYDPRWIGDNLAFNFRYLFPATIISIIILFVTALTTLVYWKKLQNKTKKIITLVLSLGVIIYVFYVFLRVYLFYRSLYG
jgi:hypothetical protein